MRELDFQRQLVGYTKGAPTGIATMLGWLHVHFRPAQTAHGWRTAGTGELAKGWPDLFLVRPRDRRVLVAELKIEGGRPTPEQRQVIDWLLACGLDVRVWHPGDIDEIAEVLR